MAIGSDCLSPKAEWMIAPVETLYAACEEDFDCRGSADDHARAPEAAEVKGSGVYVFGAANETWSGQGNAWEASAVCP